MNLPNYKRIYRQDFKKEDQELIDKLSGNLNIGIELLYTALSHRLSLYDNMAVVVKDIVVKVDASGTPTTSTNIALNDIVKSAIGAQVLFVQSQTNPIVYPTSAPFISFTQNGSTVIVNNIAGLPANVSFSVRVVIWGA